MRHPTAHDTGSKHPAFSSSEFVKRYLGIISLVSTLLIVVIFWGFYSRTTHLIQDQLLHEARAFFEEIVQTRQWIINQEGVYVKMRPDMRPDPNLENIAGLKTSITDQEGERYVLRNHAVVTRMISALAQKDQNFTINITSLNALNPDNKPDGFERTALEEFESGATEYFRLENTPAGPTFRFMAPLLTQKECLPCHALQGYKIGDIRGGISISIPAQRVIDELSAARIYTIIAAITILAMLLSAVIYISQLFVNNLKKSEEQLVELATTDSLTGILNRGEGIRRIQQEISRSLRAQQPLSIILVDIDYFKRINDNYGHQVGDRVLQTIAANLTSALRNYDIICRYGGEEFLIMLPTTELNKALETAERLRRGIAEDSTETEGGKTIALTISLGVSSLQVGDSLDGLVYRADNALYIAKEEGRDQVQFIA
jgi:diguanylate cyclase (GGDEF)-like protein